MCLLCPKEQANKGWQRGWGQGAGIRSGTDDEPQAAWSSALTNKSSSSGLGRVFILLLLMFPVFLGLLSVSQVRSVIGVLTRQCQLQLITELLNMVRSASCSSQIAGLRPSGETSPLLVTCRCILKNDSRKMTQTFINTKPAQWEVLQKVHNFKNC